ncbi:MAG: hypothetical protein ACLP3R_01985 [Candidatus Korobacteraceae bacterium]
MAERIQTPEPFVSADVAAKFLGVTRRMLLSMARMGIAGAYPIGTGNVRKHWIFRLSELTSTIAAKKTASTDPHFPESRYDPVQGSPR